MDTAAVLSQLADIGIVTVRVLNEHERPFTDAHYELRAGEWLGYSHRDGLEVSLQALLDRIRRDRSDA